MSLYSVVISPPESVIEEVAAMKQLLKNELEFYHSCHSLAHVTFNLFMGNEGTLSQWERYLANFSLNQTPLTLRFNKIGFFTNGAFFIAPDDSSKTSLILVMKKFYAGFPGPAFGKSLQPHISIGRQLDNEQLAVAKRLIKAVDISFTCDNLAIRKFNEERAQYDIYNRFYFGGKDLFSASK